MNVGELFTIKQKSPSICEISKPIAYSQKHLDVWH